MYYNNISHLKTQVGNNALSYNERKNTWSLCELTIPQLIEGTINDLTIWNNIVFEEIDHTWQLQSCIWLANLLSLTDSPIPTYIMDNHNHAFYFWHKLVNEWVLPSKMALIHIDQHADMWVPETLPDLSQLQNPSEQQDVYIAQYTNESLNVGNFIVPSQHTGLINDILQIRTVTKLLEHASYMSSNPYILDIDIDFWSDHTPSQEEIEVLKHLYKHAVVCTIALSPYFMPLEDSISVTKFLYKKMLS